MSHAPDSTLIPASRTAPPLFSFDDCVAKFSQLNQVPLGDLAGIFRELDLLSHPKVLEFREHGLGLLKGFYVKPAVERLEQWGIARNVMAIAVMAINFAPGLDHLFGVFGDKRTRQQNRNTLLSPVPVLTKIGNVIGGASEKLDPDIFPNPLLIVRGLQSYADMLKWGDWAYGLTSVNSLLELAKYALAGLVKRTTGAYHDREVSALISATLDTPNYDETTHRVWRLRNYSRLEAAAPCVALALQAANTILLQK